MPDEKRLTWHRDWLALDDQRIRRLDAWFDVNRQLERLPGWWSLSEAEQVKTRQLSGLTETEELLRVIHRRLDRSLRKMPHGPSRDYGAVLASLRVADRLIFPEENAIVSGLISRAVRDMMAIRGAS